LFVTRDCAALCYECAKGNRRIIEQAIAEPGTDGQWEVVRVDAVYEEGLHHCDNCSEVIE
jgi:hypothetical protein